MKRRSFLGRVFGASVLTVSAPVVASSMRERQPPLDHGVELVNPACAACGALFPGPDRECWYDLKPRVATCDCGWRGLVWFSRRQ